MTSTRPAVLALACALALVGGSALAADPANPDWPCIQRKVPEISAGMVWAGPPPDEARDQWEGDAEIASLVGTLAPRRTPLEEAEVAIAALAEEAGGARNERLTLLFAGLLDTLNLERAQVMAGIERYTRRQRALSERIGEATNELRSLRREKTEDPAKLERIATLEEQLNWDTRVFDEREQSLTYVCEIPVLIEQRIFALSRAIMNEME